MHFNFDAFSYEQKLIMLYIQKIKIDRLYSIAKNKYRERIVWDEKGQ